MVEWDWRKGRGLLCIPLTAHSTNGPSIPNMYTDMLVFAVFKVIFYLKNNFENCKNKHICVHIRYAGPISRMSC